MHPSLKLVAATLLLMCLSSPVFAQGHDRVIYMGGTLATIKDQTTGRINMKDENRLLFTTAKGELLQIPWAAV